MANMTALVDFRDVVAKTVGELPAAAVVHAVDVRVTAAFNDSGSNLLSVGLGADPMYFVGRADMGHGGRRAPSVTNLGEPIIGGPLAVTATYAGGNGDARAGRAVVRVNYSTP